MERPPLLMNKEDVVSEICDAYLAMMKKRKGFTPKVTDALAKAVNIAADICIKLGADPYTYVKAQERYCTLKDFYPNQLHTSSAEYKYTKYIQSNQTNLDSLFEIQKLYLADAIRSGRTVRSTLVDDMIDFSPWFRIVVTKEPIPEVIERYQDKAKEELTPTLESFLRKQSLDVTRIKG